MCVCVCVTNQIILAFQYSVCFSFYILLNVHQYWTFISICTIWYIRIFTRWVFVCNFFLPPWAFSKLIPWKKIAWWFYWTYSTGNCIPAGYQWSILSGSLQFMMPSWDFTYMTRLVVPVPCKPHKVLVITLAEQTNLTQLHSQIYDLTLFIIRCLSCKVSTLNELLEMCSNIHNLGLDISL